MALRSATPTQRRSASEPSHPTFSAVMCNAGSQVTLMAVGSFIYLALMAGAGSAAGAWLVMSRRAFSHIPLTWISFRLRVQAA